MYEDIDLDAIESNRDEAPDYRPMLQKDSIGAPVSIDRMKYLATLETEEKARYSEFSKAADTEGFGNIAKLFRTLMAEEEVHSNSVGETKTLINLKTALKRENEKVSIIQDMIDDADSSGDEKNAEKLRKMLLEEKLHIKKIEEALNEVETAIKKNYKNKEEYYCSYGVCVPATEDGGE